MNAGLAESRSMKGLSEVLSHVGEKLWTLLPLTPRKSCQRFQPAAAKAADSGGGRHHGVQAPMSRQPPPVEQVVEACDRRQEKPLRRQVLTCDCGFSQRLQNTFNNNQIDKHSHDVDSWNLNA